MTGNRWLVGVVHALILTMPAQAEAAKRKVIPFDELDRSKPIPRSEPRTWFTGADAAMLRPVPSGHHTAYVLHVDETGKVVDCTIDESSGSPMHDQALCTTLMARVTFLPALDANRQPAAGTWRARLAWN
ncbi:TonB C-terminal domain-containing protein [Sphingobium sp. BYY-5]|uniref:TonB C-terminal domain-containing protein n=1 Tax=Sphingobium sp. BYY-5 TaxID=2926400 RepID=UPI001FA774CB|nr:TonB C-terminal domain-containing protein [Sphingobium sp. BYY-5]MCI4588561.1 TonB C-terminal domain-containing protein [Sphingobium sp. BYY-5]